MRLFTSTIAALGFLYYYTGVAVEPKKLYVIENVFCVTLEQIVQVIRTSDGGDSSDAVKAINAQAGRQVCMFAKLLSAEDISKKDTATYPYQEVANDSGSWQPYKVSVVGVMTPSGILYFRPRFVYTAFLKKLAIPGVSI